MTDRSDRSDRSDRPTADAAGTVAEEAIKLMESLGAWVSAPTADRPDAGRASASGGPPEGEADEGCECADRSVPAVCQVCPICRVGVFLENLDPEFMERIADLIAMFAGSLQAAAAHRRATTSSDDGHRSSTGRAPAEPRGESTAAATRKVPVTGDSPAPQASVDAADSAE